MARLSGQRKRPVPWQLTARRCPNLRRRNESLANSQLPAVRLAGVSPGGVHLAPKPGCQQARGQHPDVLKQGRNQTGQGVDEVILDQADGLNWPTLCRCDLFFLVNKSELKNSRGQVTEGRRRQIIAAMIRSNGWL